MRLLARQCLGALVLLACGMTAGCGGKVLDFRNAELSHGKIYAGGENKPFTGKVTDIPDHVILLRREGFTTFRDWVSTVLTGNSLFQPSAMLPSLCDVKAVDGYVDGKATCRLPGRETVKYEMNYKAGALHGKFVMYELSEANKVAATGSFDNGKLHGQQEVIGPRTQKVVGRATWQHGAQEGVAEYFSDASGERTGRAEFRGGKLHGELVRWAEDGKTVLYRLQAAEGVKNGVEEFAFENGKPRERMHWKAGKLHGLKESWNESGIQTYSAIFEDGRPTSTGTSTAPPPAAAQLSETTRVCVDGWIRTHRREVGPDAAISAAQLGEWDELCQEGKSPPKS